MMVVRVDNGTSFLNLCPETAVRDKEIKFKEVECTFKDEEYLPI